MNNTCSTSSDKRHLSAFSRTASRRLKAQTLGTLSGAEVSCHALTQHPARLHLPSHCPLFALTFGLAALWPARAHKQEECLTVIKLVQKRSRTMRLLFRRELSCLRQSLYVCWIFAVFFPFFFFSFFVFTCDWPRTRAEGFYYALTTSHKSTGDFYAAFSTELHGASWNHGRFIPLVLYTRVITAPRFDGRLRWMIKRLLYRWLLKILFNIDGPFITNANWIIQQVDVKPKHKNECSLLSCQQSRFDWPSVVG